MSGLDAYDAGLLNDYGGGDVNWWQDYLRAELARAHDFYQSQVATRPTATAPVEAGEVTFELRDRVMRACMDPCAFVGPRIQAEDGTYEHMDHWRARAAIAAMTDAAAITAAEQRGAERERGNVVAWLREYGNVHCGEDMAISAMRDAGPSFANAIETGAHDG